ncbi:glycosyl transferase group 1 [Rhodopirellula sallentina SM41]|uniref:Glycosyl transferase group 1 n=1 Tax=Rhodopirellula sallentina SM41 TaxID=1263870 RepID=M5TSZ0_9BACT|nr:glycosyl transferase group 1 [Rhodopirellula sallentina SM41]
MFWRKRIRGGRLRNLKIRFRSSFKHVFNSNPDVILLSLGSLADFMLHPDLIQDLEAYQGRLIVICLFNSDNQTFNDHDRKLVGRIMSRAEHCVFVSDHNRKLAERQLATRFKSASVFSAPVSYQTEREILAWPETELQMACVARLEVFAKGQDVLLEALATPPWKDRDWHLRIYGNGKDKKYISRLVDHYRLNAKCSFPGFASDTRDIWKDCQMLVMASRAEGLSLALLEAMICGRVCVVTDVGGHAEVIEEGVSGFLADAPTPKHFAIALENAWEQRHRWQEIGTAACESAGKVFRKEPVASLMELIERQNA